MAFRPRFLFPLILCLSSVVLNAQLADSLKAGNHRRVSLKPAFDFDQRFSFIRGAQVNIWGERAGVLINDKFKAGIGGYWLAQKLKSVALLDPYGNPLYYARRNLYFGTAYIEPFLLRRRIFEISVPFELGYGESFFKSYDSHTNVLVASHQKPFIPLGASLSFSFKCPRIGGWRPPSWFGINFLAGYRYCVLENEFKTDFDGLFWSISGAIFLDRFSDDLHYWKGKRQARKAEEH